MGKIWIGFLILCAAVFHGAYASAETPGQLRAMEERGAVLAEARNRFVVQVLNGYGIPYLLNDQGMVSAIRVKDAWYTVASITIVPEVERQGDFLVVRGHNLYFRPQGEGTPLHLFSDLRIPVPH